MGSRCNGVAAARPELQQSCATNKQTRRQLTWKRFTRMGGLGRGTDGRPGDNGVGTGLGCCWLLANGSVCFVVWKCLCAVRAWVSELFGRAIGLTVAPWCCHCMLGYWFLPSPASPLWGEKMVRQVSKISRMVYFYSNNHKLLALPIKHCFC